MDNSGASDIVRRRILMIIPELGYGGAEKSFLRLARFLSKYHDVSLTVFKRHYSKGNYSQKEEEIELPLTELDVDKGAGKFSRWMRRWRGLRVLQAKADVTISFLTGANLLNVSTGGQGRKIISVRGSRKYDPLLTPFKKLLYERIIDPFTISCSDLVVSISEGLSRELMAHVGHATSRKIRTINLFFNAEELIAGSTEPIEQEVAALQGHPLIMTAGRMSREKGFQDLIKVFANVRRQIPDARLMLIGDGPLYQTLVEICRSLSLSCSNGRSNIGESAVVFLGYKRNPHRYYRLARFFVLSSHTEAFSNTVVEAMAAGTPVVAADCPWGPRSILWRDPPVLSTPYPTETPTYADYGILMPRIDQERFHQQWSDEIVKLLTQPALIQNYADCGQERVRQLDVRVLAQKWLDIIEEVCR